MAEVKGEEFQPYVKLQGTVRDDFGDYVPEVKLVYTSNTLTPDGQVATENATDIGSTVNDTFTETTTAPPTVPIQYNASGVTDSSGSFYMYIPDQYFVPNSVTLYFQPPQETTLGDKQINKISPKNASKVGPIE